MEDNERIYHFYVLVEESDPTNVRYVGTTVKSVQERFC